MIIRELVVSPPVQPGQARAGGLKTHSPSIPVRPGPAEDVLDLVSVWLIRVDLLSADDLAQLAMPLDGRERARLHALAPGHAQRRFVAAHGAARVIAGEFLGKAPDRPRWRYGNHGKPDFDGVRVSLSHSGDLAAVALSPARAVGVDIQRSLPRLDAAAVAARFYPAAEASFVSAPQRPGVRLSRFLRLWVRKEACLKVSGGRLTQGLALPVAGRGPVCVHQPGAALPGPCLVRDLRVQPGCHGAVALDGPATFRLRTHWWPAGAAPSAAPGLCHTQHRNATSEGLR